MGAPPMWFRHDVGHTGEAPVPRQEANPHLRFAARRPPYAYPAD